MNYHCHQSTSEFLDIMYANMLFPLITRPTRITSHTATLVDNIFTNQPNNYLFGGLLFSDTSDHLPIFSIFSEQCIDTDNNKYFVYRDKSEANIAKFRDCLNSINWHDLSGFNDPNKAYGLEVLWTNILKSTRHVFL